MLHFVTITFKLVELSVTLCNNFFQKDPKKACEAFLSNSLIKTVTTKKVDSIQISTDNSLQNLQERRTPFVMNDGTVGLLFWQ